MSDDFDVVVIGAGPAGYVCAIRAAQNGLKTVCVDDWQNTDGSRAFGGTCLNAGCIPSKALLESSELYYRARHEFSAHGITAKDTSVDVSTMQKRKTRIVTQFTKGIEGLFKANKVTGIPGRGKLLANRQVEVALPDGGTRTFTGKHIVLASGSEPTELKSVPFDGDRIVDSWGALEFEQMPQRLGVIGGGVIGLELGSVWQRLGSETVVLEAMDEFLFFADRQIAKQSLRQFVKQGLDIRLGAKVTGAGHSDGGVAVSYEDADGEHQIEVDKLIVAIGRRPVSADLLEAGTGVQLDERGFVQVDEECRTGVADIWAVGDLVRGPMLAHKGMEEGVMVADLMAGEIAEMNYDVIPSVIYTAPEIAWVGKTEEEVKASGRAYKVGSFPFGANGRAQALEQVTGLVKIVAAVDDDEILGVHVLGPMAGELIAEAVLAMEFSASTEDIQRTIHAHPTLSEAMHEASLSADKRSLHFVNR